ncbi:MAG: hypothetical protein RLZZ502_91, partial [Pseudomonadota bacterium]
MKVVAQRVTHARVQVDAQTVAEIQHGLLLLVGIGPNTTEATLVKAVQKIIKCRIFADAAGLMNLSVLDVGGDV